MKNTFGSSLQVTVFGESHGPYIGAVLDGLAPGIEIDDELIKHELKLRRPSGDISTKRVEEDNYQIVSGVYKGKTTGTPLCILIPNTKQHSDDYEAAERIARPGHADYTAFCKYHGFEDYHGGGHFSGRITAALVAAGSIAMSALFNKEIYVGTHIKKLSNIEDRDFNNLNEDVKALIEKEFPALDPEVTEKMKEEILKVREDGDSVGGILETVVTGVPAGVGEPFFDSVESLISHVLFSIPGVKGVEFGAGFEGVCKRGSEFNDPFRVEGEKVVTTTNNNGGINGGITNGMPILFRTAVKPTPSIYKEQDSIDINSNKNATLKVKGRHDPAIIHRAKVVVDAVTCLLIYDLISGRFGTDFFLGGKD